MKIEVLDHGYVEFVEAWGHGKAGEVNTWMGQGGDSHGDCEVGIIEAARQSTQGSFRGWEAKACDCDRKSRIAEIRERGTLGALLDAVEAPHHEECASRKQPGDARLLSFLYSNNHSTPFEFAGMVIEVQAPIFIFREWHRHRTQSYNEASARYAPLPDLNYVPTIERLLAASGNNKQAQGLKELAVDDAKRGVERMHAAYRSAQVDYDYMLKQGVPKELARLVLPVGRYSKMRASANLRNWLAFMTLRCDPAAQWEIQQYAHAVSAIIKEKFPQTHNLWAGNWKDVG